MKTFALYPGCSLESMAASYHKSALETAHALGVEFQELDDWNCCGATAYFHIDEILAHTLSARNLAIAEKAGLDVVAPCSGCYKNLFFTRLHMQEDPELAEHINYALEADNLQFTGKSEVHHLLELFVEKVGIAEIKKRVTKPLKGLRVAPYYGCQLIRPRHDHEEAEQPMFFEELLTALGAEPVNYPYKLRCCGGSLVVTNREAALGMAHDLLQSAVNEGAQVIATICPLCQVNLECYQDQVNKTFDKNYAMPTVYFTQLMGLALGIPPKKLGLGSELVPLPEAAYAMAK